MTKKEPRVIVVSTSEPEQPASQVLANPPKFSKRRAEGDLLCESFAQHGFNGCGFDAHSRRISMSYETAHQLLRILGDQFEPNDKEEDRKLY